jgi:hypothetical protein
MSKLVLATRKSPLALAQTEMVAAHLRDRLGVETELLKIVTTGDKQTEWSLEKRGGKGLFTSELEAALQRGEADVAVHSTKDLPGDMPAGLAIGGYMPRADTRDVLVLRAGVPTPRTLATGSPRRRLQVQRLFPAVQFSEIRGNVDTRLRKIGEQGVADGSVLAAAGLKRLGISEWPGRGVSPAGFRPDGAGGRAGGDCRFSAAPPTRRVLRQFSMPPRHGRSMWNVPFRTLWAAVATPRSRPMLTVLPCISSTSAPASRTLRWARRTSPLPPRRPRECCANSGFSDFLWPPLKSPLPGVASR